jgi:fatty acid-binding protein DegV
MKIRISSDSTCDLSPELLEKYDITIAPLSVIIDGQSYKDGVDVTPEDIFRAVDQGKKVQTAAVNQFEYEELFR